MKSPQMFYKFGGDVQLQDGKYSTYVADAADKEQIAEVKKTGWFETPAEAKAAGDAAAKKVEADDAKVKADAEKAANPVVWSKPK